MNSDKRKIKYSIIIPTYNHLNDCLRPCLESIIKYTDLSNVEVIIVANGCTDGTRDYVNSLGSVFRLLWMDLPAGYIKPTNLGIQHAVGDFIILLNNDIVLCDQEKNTWLRMLEKPFENPRTGMSGPYKDIRFAWDDGRITFRQNYMVFYCAMTTKDVIKKIGLLDEGFGLGYEEDVDFCIRLERSGFNLVQVPDNIYYDLNITKDHLVHNPNVNASFPIYHKDKVTFRNAPPDHTREKDLLLKKHKMIPKYSIIIPTYNHLEDCLKPCLESLIKYTDLSNVEVIIVANGCVDSTKDYVHSLGHPFKLLWIDAPSGYTKSTNEGLKVAMGEYVILVNNDMVFLPQEKNSWINQLETPFLRDKDVGITGAAKNYHEETQFNFLLFFCVMLKWETIKKFGLLDEIFNPGYGEDIDYCWKLHKAGLKIVQVPNDVSFSQVRDAADHVIHFPIWHKSSQTVHSVPGWVDIVARNEKILMDRYGKYPTGKIIPQWEKLLAAGQKIEADLNERTKLTLISKDCVDGLFRDESFVGSSIKREKLHCSTYNEIHSYVLDVGSKHAGFFGAKYTGGYCLQQHPQEISEFLFDIKNLKIQNYLEIGCADGGVTRLLCDLLSIENVHTIDLGWKDKDNPNSYRDGIDHLKNSGKINIFRGNSHSEEADKWLAGFGRIFDFVFIDADHTYEAVKKDTALAVKYAKPGTLFVYHDHAFVEGVYKFFVDIVNPNEFGLTFIRDYVSPDVATRKGLAVFRFDGKPEAKKPKVYDCFTFYNEFDLLEIRLNELNDVVDTFVLVEANRSFQGKKKPLYFNENKDRFKKFLHKIEHVIVDDFPATDSNWEREHFQRNAIARGLKNCKDNDIIMISDIDEIPRSNVIARYNPNHGIVNMAQDLYYYYFNCRCHDNWVQPKILTYAILKTTTPEEVRHLHGKVVLPLMDNAGWHFSYLGNADWIINKIESFSHTEYNTDEFKNKEHVLNCIANGKDLFKRFDPTFIEIDESFPRYVKSNLLHFASKNLIKPLGSSSLPEGWFSESETATYAKLASYIADGSSMAEIGVWKGRSLCSLENVIKGKNLKVVAVDNFAGSSSEPAIQQMAEKEDIKMIFEKNIINYGLCNHIQVIDKPSKEAADLVADNSLSLIFIDADHSYKGISEDLALWYSKLRQGGIIAGHDFAYSPGVRQAVIEWFDGRFTVEENIWYAGKESLKKPITEKNKPRYSIIIPTYNHLEDCLKPCLESIIKYTDLNNAEVIVVANGCTDGTKEYVNSLGSSFKLIWMDEAAGYIKPTNAGIRASQGEYIILLNNDTELNPQYKNFWLNILEKPFIDDPSVGITGPRKAWNDCVEAEYLIFFCVMMKRRLLNEIGLLDESFGIGYHEDIDFCINAQKAGYKLVEVPYDVTYSKNNMGDERRDCPFPMRHSGGATFWEIYHNRQEERLKANTKRLLDKHKPSPKVYDCFSFFNELDVLEIRLNELDEVVDRFVLVEARFTHQGNPKPLYFEQNKERFKKFLHKIEHVIVDEFPETNDTWVREPYQRNCAIRGLKNCKDNDIIILSDIDEIPKASVIRSYKPEMGLTCVQTNLYSYKLNYLCPIKWYKLRIFPFSEIKGGDLQQFRGSRDYDYKTTIENGGWHFSFIGNKEHVIQKIESYAHVEFNNDEVKNEQNVANAINQGVDVFGRGIKFTPVEIDDSFPKFVRDNIAYYVQKELVAEVENKQKRFHKILSDSNWGVFNEVYNIDVYGLQEKDLQNKIVIDIGAYKGHLAFRSLEMGAKKVYCFEPQPSNYKELQKNCEAYFSIYGKKPKFECYNAAVWDRSLKEISISADEDGSSIWGTRDVHKVPCVSLADAMTFVARDFAEKPEDMVLKMDCEGVEFEILFNTDPSLIKRFSIMYLEIHDNLNPNYKNKSKELLAYLNALGFVVERTAPQAGWFAADGSFTPAPVICVKLRNTKPKNDKISIGYIDHDKEVFGKYLEPSLKKSDFPTIAVRPMSSGAKSYNKILDEAKTKYVLFLHQDVGFGPGLLEAIEKSIAQHPNFGAMGIVGFDFGNNTVWSSPDHCKEVERFDACCLLVNKEHGIRFDEKTFDDLHFYVEDYCKQAISKGLKNYTLAYPSWQFDEDDSFDITKKYMKHIGSTYKKAGNQMWGKYGEYSKKFADKWSKPTYSIIIPTYNHLEDALKPCLESLIKHTDLSKVEVIVVANGCVDGTRDYVNSLGNPFKLIWIDEQAGYTRATNEGIKAARGEYVILLNNDVYLLDYQQKNEWIDILVEPFLKDPKVGITGPLKGQCPFRDADKLPGDDFMIFFCVMMRKKLFDELGLLDEDFSPGAGEDTEFCWRAMDAGYSIIQVPHDETNLHGATKYARGMYPMFHHSGKTRGDDFERVKINNVKLLQKHRTKNLRLHLTKNAEPMEGFFSADLDNPRTNLMIDARKINLHDNSVVEIIGDKLLDRFDDNELKSVISECHRVLVDNGKISLSTNDGAKDLFVSYLLRQGFAEVRATYANGITWVKASKKALDKPKIYDCFSFFNELDLLEIRLNELDPYVDHFVISEMTVTHSGKPKPLYFNDNKERFKKFWAKIIHVIVDDCPNFSDPWLREHFQRDATAKGLQNCKDSDIIIVSDLDEIPRGSRIKEFKGQRPWMFFEQHQYNYYLNMSVGISAVGPSTFSRIATYETLRKLGLKPTALRYTECSELDKISDGGWHFSWMGGADNVVTKLESWAHQELNVPKYKDVKQIEKNIENEVEALGRVDAPHKPRFVSIDSTFPKFVIDNQKSLVDKKFIKVKNQEPKIAIIMPYYNESALLIRSVTAILNQSFRNWVLFLVDDGSRSGHKASEVLGHHRSSRIVVIEKANGGVSSARNAAIDRIKADPTFTHVAYCDSDDIWTEGYLESQIANLDKCDLSYSLVQHEYEDGTKAYPVGIADPDEYPGLDFMKDSAFIFISSVVHKVACLSVGKFDDSINSIEDWDMWVRIAKAGYTFKKNKSTNIIYTVKVNNNMASKRTPEIYDRFKKKHAQ